MPKAKPDDSVKVTSLAEVSYISTGVPEMDELLGGGWAIDKLKLRKCKCGAMQAYDLERKKA